MFLGKRGYFAFIAGLSALCMTMFFNCSKTGLAIGSSDISNTSAAEMPTPLMATIAPSPVTIGGSAQVVVSGGTPPYKYGLGHTNNGQVSDSGLVSGQVAAGVLNVTVSDAAGNSFVTILPVVVASTTTSPSPTPSPSPSQNSASCTFQGISIPNGGTISAYTSNLVGCGSICSEEVLTCNNGVLGGGSGMQLYSSCSLVACTWQASGSCLHPIASATPSVCTPGEEICIGSAAGPGHGSLYICQ